MFYAEASPIQKLFESIVLGGLVSCTVIYFEYGIYFSAISGIIALVVTYKQYLKVLDGIK